MLNDSQGGESGIEDMLDVTNYSQLANQEKNPKKLR